MSSNWTNRLAVLTAAAVSVLVSGTGAAQTIECPEEMGYDFAYANPDFGRAVADGWEASIKRADGASAAGAPQLSVRKNNLRCRYLLPNGAFILITRPAPEGKDCTIRQDGYFELPYFGCE